MDKIFGKENILDIWITYIAGDIIGKENKVTVTITKNGDIKDATCNCERGNKYCEHVISVIGKIAKDEYNNDSISVKSKEYYK